MKMRKSSALLLSVLLSLMFIAAVPESTPAPAASPLDRFNAEQKKKLLAGEAIYMTVKSDEGGVTKGQGQSSVIVKAPIEDCFRIFTDFNSQEKYFPRKTKSKVIKTTGNVYTVEKAFNFYGFTVEYVMKYTVDAKNYTVNYQLDHNYPHDIDDTSGYFKFEQIDYQRTLFTYAVSKLSTGVAVPGFIQEYLSSKDLPAVVVNAKKRIESKGTWVKPD